jgi:hypothetical protein
MPARQALFILKNSVGQVKTRSWFDRLTTNGFLNYHLEGDTSVRPEQPAQRACRRVNHLSTGVLGSFNNQNSEAVTDA